MSKYYNVHLAYIQDPVTGTGEVKYVKQILNEELKYVFYNSDDEFELTITFPEGLIPGSETVFIDGQYVPSTEYDLTTGRSTIYVDSGEDKIHCTYSVILEQTAEKLVDHTEMPSLGAIDADQDYGLVN